MKNGDNSSNELVPSSQFNPESTEEFNQLVSFFDNVLADNQNDNITKIVNAAGGAVPFVGAGFAQMINHFIPNQKTERVAKTLAFDRCGNSHNWEKFGMGKKSARESFREISSAGERY